MAMLLRVGSYLPRYLGLLPSLARPLMTKIKGVKLDIPPLRFG